MDAKMRPLAWGLLLFGTAIVCAIKAAGQDLSALLPPGFPGFTSWIDAQKNPDPAWQPLGIPAGTFTLFPEVAASTGYDSNVLATNPPGGSALLETHAQLQAKSNWQTDQLGAFASIDNLLTPAEPNQGRTDWTASIGGVKQFRDDALTLGFAHFSEHEDRTALDALPTDAPIPYSVEDFRASYALSLGQLTLTPSLDVMLYRFGEATILGVPVSQAYRNRDVVQFGITADYQTAPGRDLIAVAQGLVSDYTAPQPGAPTHNSTGWQVLGGIDQTLDGVWRLRLLGGWQERLFSSPAYQDHGALVAEGDVIWSPTKLIDVTATLSRTIEDAAQESTAAYVATGIRLAAGYQWRRNVWLDAWAGFDRAAYVDTNDKQTAASLGVAATWWLNRRINLNLSETVTALRGHAPPPSSGSYTRSVSLLTLGFGL
jgi:hypothetical protein